MSSLATPENDDAGRERQRRPYDSALRRERAARTREQIVDAGSALVHGFPTWDWGALTFRAVAERAGVSERTVYRHFGNERELHEAVMSRLEQEAGVAYVGLGLDDLSEITARSFATLSSYAVAQWSTPEERYPATEAAQRRRDALTGAVAPETADWSEAERRMAVAMLDVLWGVPTLEQVIASWDLNGEQATRALTWVIDLVVDAIRDGRGPDPEPESD